jgi:hypothetical protein
MEGRTGPEIRDPGLAPLSEAKPTEKSNLKSATKAQSHLLVAGSSRRIRQISFRAASGIVAHTAYGAE